MVSDTEPEPPGAMDLLPLATTPQNVNSFALAFLVHPSACVSSLVQPSGYVSSLGFMTQNPQFYAFVSMCPHGGQRV